jgi:hypothetical protein
MLSGLFRAGHQAVLNVLEGPFLHRHGRSRKDARLVCFAGIRMPLRAGAFIHQIQNHHQSCDFDHNAVF